MTEYAPQIFRPLYETYVIEGTFPLLRMNLPDIVTTSPANLADLLEITSSENCVESEYA